MNSQMPNGTGSSSAGKKFDFKKIVEWLGFILKCPICGHKYNLEKPRVVESEQDEIIGEARMLIHSDCLKCKSSVMFNVEIRGPEVFSVGMVTDLTGQDSSKFKNLGPIKADEVIGIHQAIRAFKGDFVASFTVQNK